MMDIQTQPVDADAYLDDRRKPGRLTDINPHLKALLRREERDGLNLLDISLTDALDSDIISYSRAYPGLREMGGIIVGMVIGSVMWAAIVLILGAIVFR